MDFCTRRLRRWLIALVVISLFTGPVDQIHAQTAVESSIDGNSYSSPTFGYTLSWDDSIWSATGESTAFGYDALTLESASQAISIEGMFGYVGDPARCLETERTIIAEVLGLEDLEPVMDGNGAPVESLDADDAQGLYVVPVSASDASAASILMLECQIALPDSAVILTSSYLDPDNAGDQATAALAVLQSFTVGQPDYPDIDIETVDARIRADIADLDTYWAETYPAYGDNFVVPMLDSYTLGDIYECNGDFTTDTAAFYCPANGTFPYDVDGLTSDDLSYGVAALDMVIGHEYGHHIQTLLTLFTCGAFVCSQPNVQADELQANCFAGAWMQNAMWVGYFDPTTEQRMLKGFIFAQGVEMSDDLSAGGNGDHGTPEERVASFMAGYEGGPDACIGI